MHNSWYLITKNEQKIMNVNWKGVYPAVTTQYNEGLPINFEATTKMVDTVISEAVANCIDLNKFNLD